MTTIMTENSQFRKKKEIAQKLLWGALSILGLIILFSAFIMICCGGSKKNEIERTTVKALKIKLGFPSSLKVLAISDPDSVFTNRVCPEYELMELSERFLEYSMKIMEDSQEGLRDSESKAYRCKMDRYTDSSVALNTLNEMMERPEGKHCGWRVKIRYQSVDDSNTPYISEAWFIFDKDKKHILNSFDISLL